MINLHEVEDLALERNRTVTTAETTQEAPINGGASRATGFGMGAIVAHLFVDRLNEGSTSAGFEACCRLAVRRSQNCGVEQSGSGAA